MFEADLLAILDCNSEVVDTGPHCSQSEELNMENSQN
jgi:hypothetical protein